MINSQVVDKLVERQKEIDELTETGKELITIVLYVRDFSRNGYVELWIWEMGHVIIIEVMTRW